MARGRKRVAEPEEEVERVKKKLGAGGVRKEESLESHAVLAEQDDDVDGEEEVVNVKRRPGRKPKAVEGKRDSAEEEKEVLAEQHNDDGEEGKEEEVVNVNVNGVPEGNLRRWKESVVPLRKRKWKISPRRETTTFWKKNKILLRRRRLRERFL
jgi:hypothetical protein